MTVKTETNGQVRKTLASQLDRLDRILDNLSEGLNEAVATTVEGAVEAVSEGVKEAVHAILTEVLSNADLLAALHTALPAAPAPAAPSTPPEPPQGLLDGAWGCVKAGLGLAGGACARVAGRAAGVKTVARSAWQLAKRFKGRVLAACGVGVVAGVVTYAAGPWLGVAAGWLSGFAVSLAVQARNGLRRLFSPAAAFA